MDSANLPVGLRIKLILLNLGKPIYLVVDNASPDNMPQCWTMEDGTHIEATGYVDWIDEYPWEIWIPTEYKELWEYYIKDYYGSRTNSA